MARFTTNPSFKIGGSRKFLMHQNLVYESKRFGLQIVYGSLEDPFETDFASIPPVIPRWLLDPMGGGLLDRKGLSRKPAVLHDYKCRTAVSYEERVEADKMFREAMKAEGVGRFARNTMYAAVRANTGRMRLMRKWK